MDIFGIINIVVPNIYVGIIVIKVVIIYIIEK